MIYVHGIYSERGYRVETMLGRELYSAGNHAHDSQVYIEPGAREALTLATLRKFCAQTAREIAAEMKAEFTGVERG